MKSNKLIQMLYLLIIASLMFFFQGCSDETTTEPPVVVDEAQLLAEYIETTNYLNTDNPAIITAQAVRDLQLANPTKLLVIDIRSAADFTGKGHIENAVNKTLQELPAYMKTITPSSYEKIAVACYSGQTSGYATAMLRLLGYNNTFSLKFGMSSWNSAVANSWTPSVGNNYTNFVTTDFPKAAAGSLPVINTGKTTGKEILEARIDQLLASASPFDDIKVSWSVVTGALSNYYIVNYWPTNHYALGHLTGAMQYTPKVDLALATNLKTLPTNKPIVIYCYTGQTSAQTAMILKVMGYDAKTLLFGVNGMNYDWMGTNGLTQWKETEKKEFPFIKP